MSKLSDTQIRILEKQSLDCLDVSELTGDLVDGDLIPTLESRVISHAKCCAYCRESIESYKLTVQLASELRDQPIPTGVQNRLRRALNERLGLSLQMVE